MKAAFGLRFDFFFTFFTFLAAFFAGFLAAFLAAFLAGFFAAFLVAFFFHFLERFYSLFTLCLSLFFFLLFLFFFFLAASSARHTHGSRIAGPDNKGFLSNRRNHCSRLSCRAVSSGRTLANSAVFGVRASIIAPTAKANLRTTV